MWNVLYSQWVFTCLIDKSNKLFQYNKLVITEITYYYEVNYYEVNYYEVCAYYKFVQKFI